MPTPVQQVALAKPLNIVIQKHDDINVKFPKMGIWVLSTIGDIDVVSVKDINITSHLQSPNKQYSVLSVKEKWDYNFNPPYVFTGPFGTVDTAIAWSKTNKNQAAFEKAKAIAKSKEESVKKAFEAAQKEALKSAGGSSDGGGAPQTPPKSAPQPEPMQAPKKTALEYAKQIEEALSSNLPKIKKSQIETAAKFEKAVAKYPHMETFRRSFNRSIESMDKNIYNLQAIAKHYADYQPNAVIGDQYNGKNLIEMISQCLECEAATQELFDKIANSAV